MSKLRTARLLKGLSQAEVADQLNITQASYARLEQGKTKLTLTRIEKLSSILEVSKEYFLEGKSGENFQSIDSAITNEYIKQVAAINHELRQKIDELVKNEIAYLQEQNQMLLKLLKDSKKDLK